MKACSNEKCNLRGQLQSLENFSFNKRMKDGLSYECKACMKERVKEWYFKNKNKVRQQNKKWTENNRDKVKEYRIRYKQKDPERFKRLQKACDQRRIKNNPTKYKEIDKRKTQKRFANGKAYALHKKKLENDPHYKVWRSIVQTQHRELKQYGSKKQNKSMTLTGCTVQEFKLHIESQFQEGMTWHNRGEVWHIDHIKPVSLFDLTKEEDQRRCFHYLNQRPLWTKDNIKKSNKYDWNKKHEKLLASIKIPVL